ncbi:MAG: hypothetical protein QM703_22720 [Gemmatales bacterium]
MPEDGYAEAYQQKGRSGQEDSEATRILFCHDDKLAPFLDDLLGYSKWTGTTLERVLPDQHPYFKKRFAVSADYEDFGLPDDNDTQSASGIPQFKYQKVTVCYRSKQELILPDNQITTELDRYVIRQPSSGGSYRTIQGRMIFLSAGADGTKPALPEPPGVVSKEGGVSYTWLEVPEIDFGICPMEEVMLALKGTTNDRLFDEWYPAGTLLFEDYEMTRHNSWAFQQGAFWNITYKFLTMNNGLGYNFYDSGFGGDTSDDNIEDNNAGHNYYLNSFLASPRFDLATLNGTKTGYRTYQAGDFRKLFKYPS